jgi:hypothetical protein
VIRRWNAFVAVAGLASWLACTSGCAALRGDRHQSTDNLVLSFIYQDGKPLWNVGYSAEDQGQRIVEFVRPGQTVENWTELLTSQAFDKSAGVAGVADEVVAYRKAMTARCPGSTVEVIRQEPDGVVYEGHIVTQKEGASEHLLARVIDGASTRFVLTYSVRGPITMSPDRRSTWIQNLLDARIETAP